MHFPIRYPLICALGLAVGNSSTLPEWLRLVGWTFAVIMGAVVGVLLLDYMTSRMVYYYGLARRHSSISKESHYIDSLERLPDERFKFLVKRNLLAEIEVGRGPRISWMLEGVRIPITFAKDWYDKWQARGGDKLLPADRDWDKEESRDQKRAYNQHIRSVLKREGYIDDPGGPLPARFILSPDEALAKIGFWPVMMLIEAMEETE